MINTYDIKKWKLKHNWDNDVLVEQDMWLERLLQAISKHHYLKDRLAISGGTGLNKLWLPHPMRYSEDLDYVCLLGQGADMVHTIREVGIECGLRPAGRKSLRKKSLYPKSFLEFYSITSGTHHKLKVEVSTPPAWMNITNNHFKYVECRPEESWLLGDSMVLSMTPAYMAAMKLQAMYSRAKGRDLFDFYHLVTTLGVTVDDIVDLVESAKLNDKRFAKWTINTNRSTIKLHLETNSKFLADLDSMIEGWSTSTEFRDALRLHDEFAGEVHTKLLERKKERQMIRQRLNKGYPITGPTPKTAKYDQSKARTLKKNGYTNNQIAKLMGVSPSWAQRHTAGIKKEQKLK